MLASGSRDKSILLRDVRLPDHYIDKLAGHRSEVCGLKVGLLSPGQAADCRIMLVRACMGVQPPASVTGQATVVGDWVGRTAATGAGHCCRLSVAMSSCAVVQWSPDDKMLASGGNDNALILWQVCPLPYNVALPVLESVPCIS